MKKTYTVYFEKENNSLLCKERLETTFKNIDVRTSENPLVLHINATEVNFEPTRPLIKECGGLVSGWEKSQ